MVGSGHNLSQEEINKRQTEEFEIIMKAIYDAIGDSFYARNMDEFLGQWIIPNNLTAEEFQTTLESFSDNKEKNEYILDLTREHIYNKLFNYVGDAASDIISRLSSHRILSKVTGNNLDDLIIEFLPFLDPYIDNYITTPSDELPVTSMNSDELPVTFRVYSDDQTEEYEKKQQNNLHSPSID